MTHLHRTGQAVDRLVVALVEAMAAMAAMAVQAAG